MNFLKEIKNTYNAIKTPLKVIAFVGVPLLFSSCQENLMNKQNYIADNVHVHYADNGQDTIGATVLFHNAKDTNDIGYITVAGGRASEYAKLEPGQRFIIPGPYGDIVFRNTPDAFLPHMSKKYTAPPMAPQK